MEFLKIVAGFGGLPGAIIGVLGYSYVPNICQEVGKANSFGGITPTGYNCLLLGEAPQSEWALILGGIGALVSMGVYKLWTSRTAP